MGETKEKRGSFAEVLKIKRKSYNPNMYSQCQKYMQMCSLACEDVSPLTSKSYIYTLSIIHYSTTTG